MRLKTDRAKVPAKISAPRVVELYRRTRLFRALDVGEGHGVWVQAPAGAGKTCLVASYLAARRQRALWYNVDARDADIANLFHYLAMAAAVAAPRRKLRLPTFGGQNQPGIEPFARGFFEAFFEQLPASTAIVFDDYHEARSEAWDLVMHEALSALPPRVTAIVCSRMAPPARLTRQIAGKTLTVLGAADLRMTEKEMTELVRLQRPDLRGARLKAALPRILQSANGWAAVLSLLLQDQAIESPRDRRPDAAPERIFEYFAAEVLDKASPEGRDFLLRSSVVPSLPSALASELTGDPDAPKILADLARRSFLTQRLGDSGAYRYHPLWRSFLVERAEKELGAATLQDLRRRAAEAFIEGGHIDEAMEQLQSAEDVSLCAQLILQAAPSYASRGRTHTIATWIERLPVAIVHDHGWLSYWQAVSSVAHSPASARLLLERAFQRFTRDGDTAGQYAACGTAIQAIVHEGMDYSRIDAWVTRYGALAQSNAVCPPTVRPIVTMGMLMAAIFRVRDPAAGRVWADQALQLALASDDINYRVMVGGLLALYFVLHDDPSRAAVIVEMLRESARAAESSALPTLTLLMSDAIVRWVRGDNAECIELTREALDLARRSGVHAWSDYLATLGSSAALASDRIAEAREFIDHLAKAAQSGTAFSVGACAYQVSWDALLQGDIARAVSAGDLAEDRAPAVGYPFAQAIVSFGFAQLKAAIGQKEEAAAALLRSRTHAEQTGCDLVLFGCDLVESDFVWDDDRPHALACLARGFALARRRGYHNTFSLGRAVLTRVAERALAHDIEKDFVRTLVVKRRLVLAQAATDPDAWCWRYRVRALGRFEVVRAEEGGTRERTAAPSGPRGMPLRLLQAIVALGGRDVRDVELIDALWPDAEGDAGRRVFDTTLYRLRKQLGDSDVLLLRDGKLSLDERTCWVDVWAFDRLVVEVQQAVRAEATVEQLCSLADRLLSTYRAPLLASDLSAGYVLGPRRRLDERFRKTADLLAEALERGGAPSAAAALEARAHEAPESSQLGRLR